MKIKNHGFTLLNAALRQFRFTPLNNAKGNLTGRGRNYLTGFTLIDIVVGAGLLAVVFLGIFGAFRLGLSVLANSKAKATALFLAEQRIELIRNLPYVKIGIIDGTPPGILEATEEITRNNITYNLITSIFYIDDPFDEMYPDDLLPNDYKRAKVRVDWATFLGGEITLITDVAIYWTKCGDINADRKTDVVDIVMLENYLLYGGPPPLCEPITACADVNLDEIVDMDDIIYLTSYLFEDGPEPCEPSGTPQMD